MLTPTANMRSSITVPAEMVCPIQGRRKLAMSRVFVSTDPDDEDTGHRSERALLADGVDSRARSYVVQTTVIIRVAFAFGPTRAGLFDPTMPQPPTIA